MIYNIVRKTKTNKLVGYYLVYQIGDIMKRQMTFTTTTATIKSFDFETEQIKSEQVTVFGAISQEKMQNKYKGSKISDYSVCAKTYTIDETILYNFIVDNAISSVDVPVPTRTKKTTVSNEQ